MPSSNSCITSANALLPAFAFYAWPADTPGTLYTRYHLCHQLSLSDPYVRTVLHQTPWDFFQRIEYCFHLELGV